MKRTAADRDIAAVARRAPSGTPSPRPRPWPAEGTGPKPAMRMCTSFSPTTCPVRDHLAPVIPQRNPTVPLTSVPADWNDGPIVVLAGRRQGCGVPRVVNRLGVVLLCVAVCAQLPGAIQEA